MSPHEQSPQSLGLTGNCSPFINLFLHNFFRFAILPMKEDFLSNSPRLYVYFFFISIFCSLLINTRLVFIWYFVLLPLRKGHRDLEYQRSFFPLYLFLFAFLIFCIRLFAFLIFCIETFGFS